MDALSKAQLPVDRTVGERWAQGPSPDANLLQRMAVGVATPGIKYANLLMEALGQATKPTERAQFIEQEKLERVRGDPLQGAILGLQRGAGAAQYAVPVGRGAQALGYGALEGLLSGIGRTEEGAGVGEVAGATLLGGLTAGGIEYAPKLGAAAAKSLTKNISKFGRNIGDSAATRFAKASPSAFRKASEAGMDLNDLVRKHVPWKSNLQKIVGDVTEGGRGGLLRSKLQNAEDIIQTTIIKSGDDIVSSVDDVIAPLLKTRAKLAKVPGNKRIFDEKFGRSVIDEAKGAAVTSSQKTLANSSRRILKENFPDIKKALDIESEIYTLRPILHHAQSIGKTQGSAIRKGGLASIDVTRPWTVIEAIQGIPQVSSTVAKLGGEGKSKISDILRTNMLTSPQAQTLLGKALRTSALNLPRQQQVQPSAQEILPQALGQQVPADIATQPQAPVQPSRSWRWNATNNTSNVNNGEGNIIQSGIFNVERHV